MSKQVQLGDGKMLPKDYTARNYAITMWTDPDAVLSKGIENIRYMISGKEICPETGKTHWQCYVELNKNIRLAGLKKLLEDNTLHAEKRWGTRDQARNYCMKDKDFKEYGKWIKGQGHRSDLDTIVERLKEGEKLSQLMLEDPTTYCKYRNGLKDIGAEINKLNTPDWRNVEVVVLSGPTGCGKTRTAMKEATYKIEGSNLKWWQDYDRDDVICIDEYDNDIKITELLNLLDGYKLRLNVKGSHTYANWTKVFITTNLRKEQLHAQAKEAHINALFRRITRWENFWEEDMCDDVVQG